MTERYWKTKFMKSEEASGLINNMPILGINRYLLKGGKCLEENHNASIYF